MLKLIQLLKDLKDNKNMFSKKINKKKEPNSLKTVNQIMNCDDKLTCLILACSSCPSMFVCSYGYIWMIYASKWIRYLLFSTYRHFADKQ